MAEPLRIFIVEDERRIARFLQIELEHEGYKTAVESNGTRAFERIIQEKYDLVLLDLMLPGMDGMTICRKVREVSQIPIIMLTAKDDVEDKVNGLDNGADDYLTKPFAIQELLARIRNVMRRRAETDTPEGEKLQVRDLVMYPSRYEVQVKGQEVQLTKRNIRCLSISCATNARYSRATRSCRKSGATIMRAIRMSLTCTSAICARRSTIRFRRNLFIPYAG